MVPTHRNEYIRNEAFTIFTESLMPRIDGLETQRSLVTNKLAVDFVLDVILDSGTLFLSTPETLESLWVRIADIDDESDAGIGAWLLQAAIDFRIRAFDTDVEFSSWCSLLAKSYAAHNVNSAQKKFVIIPDAYLERMAGYETFNVLLASNIWFVFLITLQLSAGDVVGYLIQNNKHLLPGAMGSIKSKE